MNEYEDKKLNAILDGIETSESEIVKLNVEIEDAKNHLDAVIDSGQDRNEIRTATKKLNELLHEVEAEKEVLEAMKRKKIEYAPEAEKVIEKAYEEALKLFQNDYDTQVEKVKSARDLHLTEMRELASVKSKSGVLYTTYRNARLRAGITKDNTTLKYGVRLKEATIVHDTAYSGGNESIGLAYSENTMRAIYQS